MDFWARGAFHRGRRLAKADATPNFLRKAVRRFRRDGNSEDGYEPHSQRDDKDRFMPARAVVAPRRRRKKESKV